MGQELVMLSVMAYFGSSLSTLREGVFSLFKYAKLQKTIKECEIFCYERI